MLQHVTAHHLTRLACLYVRQSTLQQVFENTESTSRQYALRERALALGWTDERIVIIDQDLGHSAASTADRLGFQQLVAWVGLGQVGLVLGLEVSRLARNSSDWHHLLEICALTQTLILDEEGLYDPSTFNDLCWLLGTSVRKTGRYLRTDMQIANPGSHLLAASRPGPTLPPPTGKPTAGSCWPSTKMIVPVSPDAGTRGVLGDGKPPRFRLEDRWRAWANPTSGPACRLFPSLVQVLPVVLPPCCAMLVVCRQDEQHTTDSPRPFPAQADPARGRQKEAGQHTASCSREELLEVDAVTALKDVVRKHPARWACFPSQSKQAVGVTLLSPPTAREGQTEEDDSRSPLWAQGREPVALRDRYELAPC